MRLSFFLVTHIDGNPDEYETGMWIRNIAEI